MTGITAEEFTALLPHFEHASATTIDRLDWQVYVANTPSDQLFLPQAVQAYRSQYLVESDMGRLKGRPLSLAPVYLERDDRVTKSIRLLKVGLQVLTLVECVVCQGLAAARTAPAGLSPGNPKRATARPTIERLLERVQGLTLTIICEGRRRSHLTPLSRVQRRILVFLSFPEDIYTRLCPDSHKPPEK
jgi:transposase